MFEDLQQYAFLCGLSLNEFWDLTLKEIYIVIKGFNKKEEFEMEKQKRYIYELSSLISYFIGLNLSGKPIPQYNDIFPKQDIENKELTDRDKKAMALYRDQFLNFAMNRNKRLKAVEHNE